MYLQPYNEIFLRCPRNLFRMKSNEALGKIENAIDVHSIVLAPRGEIMIPREI